MVCIRGRVCICIITFFIGLEREAEVKSQKGQKSKIFYVFLPCSKVTTTKSNQLQRYF